MKFMFTIYHDENVLDAMPEKETQALVNSAIEYAEEIRRSGHYLASDALQPAAVGRIVSARRETAVPDSLPSPNSMKADTTRLVPRRMPKHRAAIGVVSLGFPLLVGLGAMRCGDSQRRARRRPS